MPTAPDLALLRDALQSLLATPPASPAYHRRHRLAHRLLAAHPELHDLADLRDALRQQLAGSQETAATRQARHAARAALARKPGARQWYTPQPSTVSTRTRRS
jgi:hypothetical protein